MPDTALELMERGWSARREGKYVDAHRDVVKAVSLIRQTGSHAELVNALGKLGHIEMDLDCWDEARVVYEEAVNICRENGDSLGMAHKIRHLGDVHRHAGREDDARACYQEAVSLYRSHKQPPKCDLANAVRMVAIAEEELGHVDQAKKLWTEARELYEAVNVQEGVEECSDRLAGLSP